MTEAIKYLDRYRQVISFENFVFGDVQATDLDGVMDFHGKAFVFLEVKYGPKALPTGQRILLERLCDMLPVHTLAIVAWHNKEPQDVVVARDCFVYQYYSGGEWHYLGTDKGLSVYTLITEFLKKKGLYGSLRTL